MLRELWNDIVEEAYEGPATMVYLAGGLVLCALALLVMLAWKAVTNPPEAAAVVGVLVSPYVAGKLLVAYEGRRRR
jgi:hypothetical protein